MSQLSLKTLEIPLVEFSEEPRVRDTDLAERLGFDRPRSIRKIIARNKDEINQYGECAIRMERTSIPMPRGGSREMTVTENWLNEEQAFLLTLLSKAANARQVRKMLIHSFGEWHKAKHAAPALPPARDACETTRLRQETVMLRSDLREEGARYERARQEIWEEMDRLADMSDEIRADHALVRSEVAALVTLRDDILAEIGRTRPAREPRTLEGPLFRRRPGRPRKDGLS